eukprot:m.220660 g.220660  ORF g.220660 m.220660 type:complete len:840 (-) comp10430_c0_seq1:118-2637(-)
MTTSDTFFQATASNISRLLIQVIIVVTVAAFVSRLLAIIKQPSAVAQIISGIILGPTVLGNIPNFSESIFPASSLPIFQTLADFGLVWFMLLIGLEVNIDVLKRHFKHAMIISVTGVVFPFFVGVALAQLLIAEGYAATVDSHFYFSTFLGVSVCITAFPVLARIISERYLLGTNLGMLVLGSAAVDDFIAWIVLAAVVSLVRAGSGLNALYVFLCLVGYCILMALVGGPLLTKLCERVSDPANNTRLFLFFLVCTMASAWYTEAIGVHAIFGAFIFGLVVPREHQINIKFAHRVEDYVVTLLLPMYFAKSGLSTQLGLITTGTDWGLCILIIVGACFGKIVPGVLTARLCGRTWKESWVVGFLRTAKGLVELIVLNIGLELNLLSAKVFGMLVLMAVITTLLATPLMYLVYPPKKIIADDDAAKTAHHFRRDTFNARTVQRPQLKKATTAAEEKNSHSSSKGAARGDEKNGSISSRSSSPVFSDFPEAIMACFFTESQAVSMLGAAKVMSPPLTDGRVHLYLARLQEVNEKPSSFMEASSQLALAEEQQLSPSRSPGPRSRSPHPHHPELFSPVLRLRAQLLEMKYDSCTIATPWYSDASEQIIEVAVSHAATIILFQYTNISTLSLAQKVLRHSPVHAAGMFIAPDHLKLEDPHPIKFVFFSFASDTDDRIQFAKVLRLAETSKAKNFSISLFIPSELAAEATRECDLLTNKYGVRLITAAAGPSFEHMALQASLAGSPSTIVDGAASTHMVPYDLVIVGIFDDAECPAKTQAIVTTAHSQPDTAFIVLVSEIVSIPPPVDTIEEEHVAELPNIASRTILLDGIAAPIHINVDESLV